MISDNKNYIILIVTEGAHTLIILITLTIVGFKTI